VDVRIETTDFPAAGAHVKGGCGSSRTLDEKAAFKINLSWDDPAVPGCATSRKYKGLKKFTLNNQVEDASFTHERIGYDFFQKLGVPVPRAAPIRLHVNKQLWGLYLHVENIDRRFLARHFDSKYGMLYEADYGCDIGEESCFEPEFDTDECDDPPVGDPTDMTPLQNLNIRLAQLPTDDFYPAIEKIFDFDTYLTTWAASSIMGFWDGYPNDANNYRIYHDPTDDRWTLIPTGIDQLFENDVDPCHPAGMLSIRCLADEDCKAAFRARLADVLDRFEVSDYPAMARAIAKQIGPEVAADRRKDIGLSEWHAAVDSTIQYIQERPAKIRKLLAQSDQQTLARDFYSRVFSDPSGKSFVVVTWTDHGDGSKSTQRLLTAKGFFQGLSARIDAYDVTGGNSNGPKVGNVVINFAGCESAAFTFSSDVDGLADLRRTMQVDPSTWKYCE